MENIIWKPVKGYEDYYEVSNHGEVRTIERYVELPTYKYLKKQKILTQFTDGKGYMHVKLYDGKGNPKSITVHRIVALTFLEKPDNCIEVNHVDYVKNNNHVSNLKWSTRAENVKHAYLARDPKTYKGSGNKNSKLTEEQVIQMREEYKTGKFTYKQLAEKYLVGTTLVGYIVKNQVWKHV